MTIQLKSPAFEVFNNCLFTSAITSDLKHKNTMLASKNRTLFVYHGNHHVEDLEILFGKIDWVIHHPFHCKLLSSSAFKTKLTDMNNYIFLRQFHQFTCLSKTSSCTYCHVRSKSYFVCFGWKGFSYQCTFSRFTDLFQYSWFVGFSSFQVSEWTSCARALCIVYFMLQTRWLVLMQNHVSPNILRQG